jgi:hypothetical protein
MTGAKNQRKARIQFTLIAAVFIAPLIIAAWLYLQGGALQPAGRTNHGALLEPITNLGALLPLPGALDQTNTGWLLLYSNPAYCDEICRRALHTLRQSRLMLGNEMGRVQRVFLHGDTVPDTVFLAEEHRGLITAENSSLTGLLIEKRPANLPAGGYYLIDPLGNLVMYFRPDLEPAGMVDDIKHLLRLSRIG